MVRRAARTKSARCQFLPVASKECHTHIQWASVMVHSVTYPTALIPLVLTCNVSKQRSRYLRGNQVSETNSTCWNKINGFTEHRKMVIVRTQVFLTIRAKLRMKLRKKTSVSGWFQIRIFNGTFLRRHWNLKLKITLRPLFLLLIKIGAFPPFSLIIIFLFYECSQWDLIVSKS